MKIADAVEFAVPTVDSLIKEVHEFWGRPQRKLAKKCGCCGQVLNDVEHDRRQLADEMIKKFSEELCLYSEKLYYPVGRIDEPDGTQFCIKCGKGVDYHGERIDKCNFV